MISKNMVQHYLVYWRPHNVESRLAQQFLLDHAGSSQFRHVKPSDVLWFVTVRKGKLFLVGRLVVGEQTDQEGAVKLLGKPVVEKGRFLVTAKPGTEENMRDIPLQDIAEQLRFESADNDRFTIIRGMLNPQQLQMKRRLNEKSSRLITTKWNSSSTSSLKRSQEI
jgi:hypothetical protein